MSNFQKVAKVTDIPDGELKMVSVGGNDLCLANSGGTLYCIENNCPHQGGPLSEGVLAGKVVTCPWHNWKIDITTGQGVHNPMAVVNSFEVKVEGDDVMVKA